MGNIVLFKKSKKINNNKLATLSFTLFSFSFIIYLSFGLLLSKTPAFTISGVLFETDTPRVISDTTDFFADHYRTKVHPLYVLIVNPLGILLGKSIGSNVVAVIILNSVFGSIGVLLAFAYFLKITDDLQKSWLLAAFFGLSASQFFLSALPETSTLAVCSLLTTYLLFVTSVKDKSVNLQKWIIAGIFTLSITSTNFIQTLICFFIASFITTPEKNNKILRAFNLTFLFLVAVISCTIALALLQKSIYPTTRLFFTFDQYEEETLYTSFMIIDSPFKVILQLLRHFFLVNIVAPYPNVFVLREELLAITFGRALKYSILGWMAVILWVVMFSINLKKMLLEKNIFVLTIHFAFILCLFFNLGLHSIYGVGSDGNFEYFLYTGNFTFLAISFMSYMSPSSNKLSKNLLILLVTLTGINNLIMLLEIIKVYS